MSFSEELARLCAKELPHARSDNERGAEFVEALASQLALGVAVLAEGRPEHISELLEGASSYMFEAASAKAPFGQFMAQHVRPRS